jgi:hypothetical protein
VPNDVMCQEAPYPVVLAELVNKVRYKPGWRFHLEDMDRGQGSKGLTLTIGITGPDSYHPEQRITVVHYMLVPPAAYDERSWCRWLFDQVLLVERHEAMEFFQIAHPMGADPATTLNTWTTERPYAPSHGPGNDPYLIREVGTVEDQRTAFTGEVLDH